MCGIVGYVGPKTVVPILVNGLEKLEYRGYDSAGIAVITKEKFEVFRTEGKLVNLKDLLSQTAGELLNKSSVNGKAHVGIGHTRWATHGRPSETNAHPHTAGNVCVVHNGIIENYQELKEKLTKKGYSFSSDTDTEIAAQLINDHLEETKNLLDAVRAATKELRGSYALLAISLIDPEYTVVAKNSTPIIIGIGEGENFVASDIPAILDHTRQMVVLEDGEIAKVQRDSVSVEKDGKVIDRKPITITWDAVTAEKGGYRHFMLKEIHEQPQAVTDTIRGRVNRDSGDVFLDDVTLSDKELKNISSVRIVACGTAWHAALVSKFYFEKLARIRVEVDYGSEFRYRDPLIDKTTLFVVISQSGETADTLGSLQVAKEQGARTLGICNVVGSSITRKAESTLYTHAGPEISVASTKAFVTQLTASYLLALKLGRVRGVVTEKTCLERIEELAKLPSNITHALTFDRSIEKIARKYGKSEHFMFLGRGFLYPIALEGALKLKEISYMHAEGYPAGEMKHGPIALIDEETPVVVVLGHDGANYEKSMSNLKEVESRGGRIIAVTDLETRELQEVAWEVISVGEVPVPMLPIVLTVPLQLLAYHVAVYRGTDVDQPRNLAKSVTVE